MTKTDATKEPPPSQENLRLDNVVHALVVFSNRSRDPRNEGLTLCYVYEWFWPEMFARTKGASITTDPPTCMLCIAAAS